MKKTSYWILALALLAAGCSVKESGPEAVPSLPEEQDEAPALVDGCYAGQAVVEFEDWMIALIEDDLSAGLVETKSEALNDVLQELGIVSLERVFPDAGEFEPRSRAAGMHRFYTVFFSEDMPVTKALGELSDLPGIVSADPVRPVRRRAVFNDPMLSRQWHYNGSNASAHIHVEDVWKNYTTGSSDVVVCIVDEPVDPTHPDLMANLWKDASGHTGYNFARSSYDLTIRPESGNGDVGHGTHVAGTVAAVNNNGIGLCGIAGGNAALGIAGVRLQSCAIFSGSRSASDAATCNAVKWGADHGAVISQNSWGYYADENEDGTVSASELASYKQMKISAAMKAAIDYFIKYAGCDNSGNQLSDAPMKGGLVFFAAGNENIDYDVTCDYEPVIAVGATQQSGAKSSYSNWGSWVDIAAPGGEGYSSANSIWSTLPVSIESSGYGGVYWAGTSMACPHASGVAALIVSYFGQPGFTNNDLKSILYGGLGDTVGGSRPVGKKLRALEAFQWALANGYSPAGTSEEPLPPVIRLDEMPKEIHAHETRTVHLQVSDPNHDAFTVTLTPGSAALTLKDEGSGRWALTFIGRNALAGTYTATLLAKDETGLSSEATFTYKILENHAPVIIGKADDCLFRALGEFVEIDPATLFSDPDGEALTYGIEKTSGSAVMASFTGSVIRITGVDYGFSTVTLLAKDALDETCRLQVQVLVKNPSEQTISAYPNPVKNMMFVRIDEVGVKTRIEIFSASGALVMDEDILGASAFSPIEIPVGSLSPGRYVVRATYLGHTASRSFVKI